MLVCSCNKKGDGDIVPVANAIRTELSACSSFGGAVGRLRNATHPKNDGGQCFDCLPNLGEVLVKLDIRPRDEFDVWKNEFRAKQQKKCETCTKQSCRAIAFDYSPLR